MGFYVANTNEQRSRLKLMIKTAQLLRALSENQDLDLKKEVLTEVAFEVKIRHLKNRMVEIFQYKIGGDDRKLHIYLSN